MRNALLSMAAIALGLTLYIATSTADEPTAVSPSAIQSASIPNPNCELFPPSCSCACLGECNRAFDACYASCGGNFTCQLGCLLENSCCVDICCGDTPQQCT